MNDDVRKTEFSLADFPFHSSEKVRWGDTDALGHVNNAVFVTFCESGRGELLRQLSSQFSEPGLSFFVARVAVDFRAELNFPGTVDIGNGIKTAGRSSVTFVQGLFQNGKCAATAESVLVRISIETRRPVPLSDNMRLRLKDYTLA